MNKKWSFKKHTLWSLVIIGLLMLMELGLSKLPAEARLIAFMKLQAFFTPHEAASVAIIGGADGPTAYYFTGSPLAMYMFINTILFCVLLALYKPIVYLMSKEKGNV